MTCQMSWMTVATNRAESHRLQHVQRLRKYVLRLGFVLCLGLLLFSDSQWRAEVPHVFQVISQAGTVLILLCVAGRTWCTLYIGGQKKRRLVTVGPYSVVRNPLYVFTTIGAAGVGASAGSVVLALLLGLLVAAVFYIVAIQEQAFLADSFGSEYAAYAERVPLFFPRFSTWRDADQLTVNPKLVRRTFMDASLFLLAIPLTDVVDWLQDAGWVPVFVSLP